MRHDESMLRTARAVCFGAACVLLSTASLEAQLSTAQLTGSVIDQGGDAVAGATVTALQSETGFTRTVHTDVNGSYAISNLPPGEYRVEGFLRGFRPCIRAAIRLEVATASVVDAVLSVGTFEDAVTLHGGAP